jgi:methylated-DNA-protein-cysteine methyltransferase related protein
VSRERKASRDRKGVFALLGPAGRAAPRRRARIAPADHPALQAMWHVVSEIPRGQVSTYGAVARAAGLPGRARQAGTALRLAPPELHLPWHRVVGAGGHIVFARSSAEFREQVRRLRAEGVQVRNGRIARAFLCDPEGC